MNTAMDAVQEWMVKIMSEYIKKKDAVEIVEHNLSRFMIAMKIGGFDSEEEIIPIKYGRLLYKGPVFFYLW